MMMSNVISSSSLGHAPLTAITSPINPIKDRVVIPQNASNNKVMFVLGTTAAGKSRLAIDLAARFDGEVINSDCMQVYKGLDIVTNKANFGERRGVRHHLLGTVPTDEDFTTEEFVSNASRIVGDIAHRGKLPVIAGGSNYWVQALANDDIHFRDMYKCCFFWVDVSMPVLYETISKRVDKMVAAGLVEEGRDYFDPTGDYKHGIRQSIGVPEMHWYYKNELIASEYAKSKLLERAIGEIKSNTYELACHQHQKIKELKKLLMWKVHRIDATKVFTESGCEAEEAWESLVLGPSAKVASAFLM